MGFTSAPHLPLDGFCLGVCCYHASSPIRGLHLPPRGSCSHSPLTPAHGVHFSPLPHTFFAPGLGFAQWAFHSLPSQLALRLPSPLRSGFPSRLHVSCRRTRRLLTSRPRFRFVFRKASAAVVLVGHLKYLDQSFRHPPSLVFFLLLGYSSIHPLAGTLQSPQLAPHCPTLTWLASYCCSPIVDLQSLYKNPDQLYISFSPSLIQSWHP